MLCGAHGTHLDIFPPALTDQAHAHILDIYFVTMCFLSVGAVEDVHGMLNIKCPICDMLTMLMLYKNR